MLPLERADIQRPLLPHGARQLRRDLASHGRAVRSERRRAPGPSAPLGQLRRAGSAAGYGAAEYAKAMGGRPEGARTGRPGCFRMLVPGFFRVGQPRRCFCGLAVWGLACAGWRPTVIRPGAQLTERARDLFAVFRELGLGLEVEVSVVGVDRHEEIMQESLEPGQPEGVGPRIAEPDRRVPGELVSAISQCEAYAS
jgi:hypothetical protein